MHKKFEINHTKIKGGRQSGRKVWTHNSKSDLSLAVCSGDSQVDNFLFFFFSENFVVIWKKVEPGKNAEDILAMGSTVLKNDNRFSVEINREGDKKGSTLVIALAEDADKGHYLCQLGSNNKKKELKHTVTVRGKIFFYPR